MPDISYHAEQAVLGALLAGPQRATEVNGLTPLDFAGRRHQAIFTAITRASEPARGLLGRLRDWLTRLPLRSQLRDLSQYMAELPARCPDPASLPSYLQMVAEASRQRGALAQVRAAQQADPISHLEDTAAWLAEQSRQAAEQASRLRRTTPAASTPASGLPRDVEQLARALAGRTNRAAPAPAGAAHSASESGASGRQAGVAADAERSAPAPAGTTTQREPRQPVRGEDIQELILADLLQRPGSVQDITWLPPEVFTAGAQRQLYMLICDRAGDGLPVDPLIIAWEARKMVVPADNGDKPPARQIDPEDVLRVGALEAAPGTAALLGRALLADQLWTECFGPDWPRDAHRIRPAARTEPVPDVTAEPDPAPAPAGPEPQAKPEPQAIPRPAQQPVPAAAALPGPRQHANGAAPAPALLDSPPAGPGWPRPAPRI